MNKRVLNHHEIFDVNFLLLLHKIMFGKVWKLTGELRNSDKNIDCDFIPF
jgi:fido (protein-threonine AMPylation protein)